MMHLNKVILLLLFFSTCTFSNMYEDSDNTFLKPESIFVHQPIEVKSNGLSGTLLSVKQKDGVGFYLINGENITYVTGVRFTDKVESIFFYKKDTLIIISSSNESSSRAKGTAYNIKSLDVVGDKKEGKIVFYDGPGPDSWNYCLDGVYSDGRVSKCPYKDAASVKKFLDGIQPK